MLDKLAAYHTVTLNFYFTFLLPSSRLCECRVYSWGGVRFDIVLVSVRAVFYVSYWYHTVVLPIMFVRHNFELDFLREEFVAHTLVRTVDWFHEASLGRTWLMVCQAWWVM